MTGLARYDGKLWAICKLRKPTTCFLTKAALHVGDEAWRPISNGYDRMNRIAKDAMPEVARVP